MVLEVSRVHSDGDKMTRHLATLRVIVTLAVYPRLSACVCDVCVYVCDLCACVHKCVFDWLLALACTELGVSPEHHIGNLCVVTLSRTFSPDFDAFLRRLGSRHACELALLWIGTGDA